MEQNSRLKGNFGIISNLVVRDPQITPTEKGLYSLLASYSDSITNETTVGEKRLASEMDMSESSIKRLLKSLVNKGVIMRRYRGKNLTYITVILK